MAVSSLAAKKKILEVERMAEMERQKRQKELEQKNIEEEANKRIEELVAKRVAEELERRREEIEAEVSRRVEEAKRAMEAKMLEDMERQKQEQIEETRRREVRLEFFLRWHLGQKSRSDHVNFSFRASKKAKDSLIHSLIIFLNILATKSPQKCQNILLYFIY